MTSLFFRWLTPAALILATGLLRAENRALLVGVTEYPSLDKEQWLVGPANDVDLAREVLTDERFQFPAKNITSLAGWPAEEEQRLPSQFPVQCCAPTRLRGIFEPTKRLGPVDDLQDNK